MNVTEKIVGGKPVFAPYQFQKYPMKMYLPNGASITVTGEAEEGSALDDGYTETLPAIPPSIAVAPMSTQPALQAAHEALQRELQDKTAEFNVKHSMLQVKYDALDRNYNVLSDTHLALQGDHAELQQTHETLKEAHLALANEMERHIQTPDPTQENVSEPVADNPFAQMKS